MKKFLSSVLTLTILPVSTSSALVAAQNLLKSSDSQIQKNEETDIPPEWLDVSNGVLYGFKPEIKVSQLYSKETLIIPSDVTRIEDAAFAGVFDGYCCHVKNIIFNSSLVSIGNMAFSRCYGITGVLDLSGCSSLTYIGGEAFFSCAFTSVSFPNSLIEIGPQAFKYCQNIEGELVLPPSLQRVGTMAFANCYLISKIDWSHFGLIPAWMLVNNSIFNETGRSAGDDKTVVIDVSQDSEEDWNDVFSRQNLVDFNIDVLKVTDKSCFKISENGEIEGPADGVQWENYDVFSIPSKNEPAITKIKANAFSGANAITHRMRLKLNDELQTIGQSAFSGSTGLYGDIIFTENFSSLDESSFAGCTNIEKFDLSKTTISTFPKNVFNGCTNLKSVSWPNTINNLDVNAFTGCTKLDSIDVSTYAPEALPEFEIKGDEEKDRPLFNVSKMGTVYLNSDMNDQMVINAWVNAFNGAGLDTNSGEKFADGKNWSFYQKDTNLPFDHILFSVSRNTVLNGFKSAALQYLDSYDVLQIPTQIQEIKNNAFESIFLEQGHWKLELNYGLRKIGDEAFANCNKLVGKLSIPKTVSYIGNRAFYNDCHFRNELVIPNNVSHIGAQAFDGCVFLWSDNLVLPNALTDIESFAFGNTKISKITIPTSLSKISPCAFSNISTLTAFDLSLFNSFEDFQRVQLSSYSFDVLPTDGKIFVKNGISSEDQTKWLNYLHQNGLPGGWSIETNGGELWK